MQNRFTLFRSGLLAAALVFLPFAVSAQSNVPPRIAAAAVNESQLTTLRGNTHPLARPEFDRGPAPDSLPMARMLLVLTRSAAQETALEALLNQQQDSSSPNYHQWLTPQQFGLQFGPADADIETITLWLQSHGFTVNRVSNGRTVIEFSGTAGQVREAFHTQIHQYNVNGENHWANASDPQIPTALTPVVAGIDSLYNFPRHAMYHVEGPVSRSKTTGKVEPATPLFTLGGNCGVPGLECYGVTPYDFATIYNELPLWNAAPAIDGTGQTIAIVAETDIAMADVQDFRSYFGLAAKNPTIILDGPDPGTVQGDETESDLDVEWAGAVAKGATIDVVTSATTESSLGVDLSAQYIVDNNLAGILSESYGICELFLGSAGNQFYNQLWQQASAQGITALVATGDSGSAVCDRNAETSGAAELGLSVSGFSSTPYNVAVGGTDFFDLTNPATYWNGINAVPPGAPAGTPATLSAISYIPETTWNDSCTNAVFGNLLGYSNNAETNCNDSQLVGFVTAVGGSGGKSNCTTYDGTSPSSCTGGYAKPTWQTGTGVPADGKRDVPDVSLFAASGSPSGAFYLICEADGVQAGSTSCDSSDPSTEFLAVGGTSASTPAFAGIMALVEQKTGSRQGNANYILYKLAAQPGASCNSSSGAGTNCVFYDVTNGTIAMPCVTGSPNCNTTFAGDVVGVLAGYATTTGYDQATGLGSVNANDLVMKWTTADMALKTSTTTLTLNSGTAVHIVHGASVPVSISVTGSGGTPTGNVSLVADTTFPTAPAEVTQEGVLGLTLSGGTAAGSTNALPGGTYNVVAQYAGDSTFAASTSNPPTSVTVTPEASKITFAYELINPTTGAVTNSNATTATFGTPARLRVNVTSLAGDACPNNGPGNSGCPTGNISLADNGTALDGGTFVLNPQGYTEDQTIDLGGGTNVLAATYNGDNSFTAPSPNPATTSLAITPATTTNTMSAEPTSAVVGGLVTLGATITAESIFSSHAPSGSFTFYNGATPVGTTSGGDTGVDPATHQATFTAQLNTTTLPKGQDTLTAKYSGDSSYAASTSAPVTVSVLYPATASLSSSSPTSSYGSSVTFTAEVTTTQSGGPAITGNVSFSTDYGLSLGSVALSSGSAQVTSSAISGGVHNVIAFYSGDTNYESVSGTVTQTVTKVGTTAAVTSSSNTITSGQSVTLTSTISGGVSGAQAPSGFVLFESNGGAIGSPAPISGGQAQVTTTSLAVGSDQITAVYAGDGNYSGSTSPAITETVNPAPTFVMSLNPTVIPVMAPGQAGTATLTFTAMGGFSSNGTVTIAPICSGMPSETSCSSGNSVTIPANGSAMATITFQTTAPSAVAPVSPNRPNFTGWKTAGGTLALASLLCAAMIMFSYRAKRRRWGIALMFTVFALLAVSIGCGGGGSGGSGPPPNPGTPVGMDSSVSVSVTINGVTQTLSGLTLNVE